MMKVAGTWSGMVEKRREVSALSDNLKLQLSLSATSLNAPLMCCPYKQHLVPMNTLANWCAMIWSKGLVASSALALWSQPNAEVLSMKEKKQENGGALPSSTSIHTELMVAKNSSLLFSFLIANRKLGGIWKHHALPELYKPPSPWWHVLDHQMWVGLWKVSRFIKIPTCACLRSSNQSCRSSSTPCSTRVCKKILLLCLWSDEFSWERILLVEWCDLHCSGGWWGCWDLWTWCICFEALCRFLLTKLWACLEVD